MSCQRVLFYARVAMILVGLMPEGYSWVWGMPRTYFEGFYPYHPRTGLPRQAQGTVGSHEGIRRQNGYISSTTPPIRILRPLFTLQLLILPTGDPFQAQIC